jgi:hypothetical protein
MTESDMIFQDGLTTLRAWQQDNTPLTLFTHNVPSFLNGTQETKISHVDQTGRVVVVQPSFKIDLTQAELKMIEADMVPDDFWILQGDIVKGYKRFLSATFPKGGKAVFGEREPNHLGPVPETNLSNWRRQEPSI